MENTRDFPGLLKEKGLKCTRQRLAVLQVLEDSADNHRTAEEIYDLVKKNHPDIGLATVYRTLQLLSELQVIDKVNLDDGCIRYELGREYDFKKHHHHHLICLSCGKIVSYEDDFLEALEAHILESTGFEVADHEVKLYGYCRACRESQGQETAR